MNLLGLTFGAWRCKWSCQAVCCRTRLGQWAWTRRRQVSYQAIWNQTAPSDVCDAPGDFRSRAGSRGGFYTTLDGGLEAMLFWGPITSETCIGVTRGHSRL